MKKDKKINLLLTSVGRRSYLVKYFKDAIGDNGSVHVANSSNLSPAFLVADYSVVTPIIYDDNYIPFLLDYCKKNEINVLISLFDIDLPMLAKNKEKFKNIGTQVIVSDETVTRICNDKWETYLLLKNNAIHVPNSFISIDEAIKAIELGELTYPVFVKPRWGMGSLSVYQADNSEELLVFYNKIKRDLYDSYLKYESVQDIDRAVIIQEKLCGQEYGLDVINDLSLQYLTTIVKKKLAMRSGETDTAITVDSSVLINLGKEISAIMSHVANLDVDVFLCDGKPFVLEMNARFGGGYPFSHMSGVDLPKYIIEVIRGNSPDLSLLKSKNNVLAQKDINMVVLKEGE